MTRLKNEFFQEAHCLILALRGRLVVGGKELDEFAL